MKKAGQFLLTILLLIVVVSAGLLVGRHISNLQKPLTPQEQALLERKKAEEQALKQERQRQKNIQKQKNKADYLATMPSYGPIIKIHILDVTYEGIQATALLEKTDLKNLKTGQKVVLYDDQEYPLPLGGKIGRINIENNKYQIMINLPEGTNTEYLSSKVGVITMETIASQRIPLSALQKDKKQNIIWLAYKNEKNEFFVKPQRIDIILQNSEFFEAGQNLIGFDQLIITNPDRALEENTAYDLYITKLNAPLHNPIKQAWIDYELYRLEKDQERLIKRAEDCFNGAKEPQEGDATIAGGSETNLGRSSCGGTVDESDIMFKVFQSLTIPQNNANGGAGGCGSPSSACGQ